MKHVLLAIATTTCGVLPGFLTGGLAVQIRNELRFGEAELGLAVAVFFGFSALLSVVSGRLVERIGVKAGMQVAAVGSAATLLCVALFAWSWALLVACLILGGFANSVGHPASNLALARGVSQERQGLAFGIKQSAIPAATLLAGLSVPIIATTVGWRWAFAGGAVLSLSVALMVALILSGGESTPQARAPLPEARSADASLLALLLLSVGIGVGSAAATPLGAFTVETAVAAGIDVGIAGLLLAFGSVIGIVVRVAVGYRADGMTGGRLSLVASMLFLGCIAYLMLASGSSWLLFAGVALGFGAGWGWPGLFNFAVVKSSPNAPAAATGITQTGASSGAAAGPLFFGLLVEHTSYGFAWITAGVLALLAAAAILAGRMIVVRDRPPARN